jgi:hypothetical protein
VYLLFSAHEAVCGRIVVRSSWLEQNVLMEPENLRKTDAEDVMRSDHLNISCPVPGI